MSLSAIIQPYKFEDKTANKLSCFVTNYDLKGQNCNLYWYLSSLEEENVIIHHGSYNVPTQILELWGTSDDIIIESLANYLGLTIVSILN